MLIQQYAVKDSENHGSITTFAFLTNGFSIRTVTVAFVCKSPKSPFIAICKSALMVRRCKKSCLGISI